MSEWTSVSAGANWKAEKTGDNVIGYYYQTLEGQGKDKNSSIHSLKAKDGTIHTLWGSFVLNDKLSKVQPGQYIKIEYLGMAEPKKGGRPYHNWDIAINNNEPPMSGANVARAESGIDESTQTNTTPPTSPCFYK